MLQTIRCISVRSQVQHSHLHVILAITIGNHIVIYRNSKCVFFFILSKGSYGISIQNRYALNKYFSHGNHHVNWSNIEVMNKSIQSCFNLRKYLDSRPRNISKCCHNAYLLISTLNAAHIIYYKLFDIPVQTDKKSLALAENKSNFV